jgi:hypothetical protein
MVTGCISLLELALGGLCVDPLAREAGDLLFRSAHHGAIFLMQNADAQANMAALRKISSTWQQGDYLEKGGWATRPGATSPDYELGRACAAKLIEAKAASQ